MQLAELAYLVVFIVVGIAILRIADTLTKINRNLHQIAASLKPKL